MLRGISDTIAVAIYFQHIELQINCNSRYYLMPWKRFPHYWTSCENHRRPMDSHHKKSIIIFSCWTNSRFGGLIFLEAMALMWRHCNTCCVWLGLKNKRWRWCPFDGHVRRFPFRDEVDDEHIVTVLFKYGLHISPHKFITPIQSDTLHYATQTGSSAVWRRPWRNNGNVEPNLSGYTMKSLI